MSKKASSSNPSKELKTTYSPTLSQENLFFIPSPTSVSMAEPIIKKVSKITESNPKRPIIVDTIKAFGWPIETEFQTNTTLLETPKMGTSSGNPKEPGFSTLSELNPI